MDETEAKRDTISERLEYIENQLNELEEEKEELKEFQEKDKERRCLEYALYSRELEEVTETLAEIEEERKNEVHNANTRRLKFNEREKEIQVIHLSYTDYDDTDVRDRIWRSQFVTENTSWTPLLHPAKTRSPNSPNSSGPEPSSNAPLTIFVVLKTVLVAKKKTLNVASKRSTLILLARRRRCPS
jgi:hypothetical protein